MLVGRVALEGHSARQANVESAFRSVGPRGDEIDDLAGWAAGRWTVDQVDVTAVRQGGVKAGERRGDTGPGELEPCLGLLDDLGLEGLNVIVGVDLHGIELRHEEAAGGIDEQAVTLVEPIECATRQRPR